MECKPTLKYEKSFMKMYIIRGGIVVHLKISVE